MSLTLHLLNCYFVVRKCKASLVNLEKIIFLIILKLEINPTPCLHCIIKKKYELLYVESSRIYCTIRKINDDYTKLWRQCNDGISWIFNNCLPPKNQFCLLGIQIYGCIFLCPLYNHAIIINIINSFYLGTMISLNALMKDSNDVSRYFNLFECEIPLIPCDSNVIVKLITLLLTVRVCMLMILFFYYYCHINN